jgi:hypothetical protein
MKTSNTLTEAEVEHLLELDADCMVGIAKALRDGAKQMKKTPEELIESIGEHISQSALWLKCALALANGEPLCPSGLLGHHRAFMRAQEIMKRLEGRGF